MTADVQVETVLYCTDLDAMSTFFGDLGFRIETISPADDPAQIVMSGFGARLCLRRAATDVAGNLVVRTDRLAAGAPVEQVRAPNGTLVEFVSASHEVVVPEAQPSLSVARATADNAFGVGRAGMGYRDLLPDRWGGRFIASHIRIADGGDVADYVHFHRIRFQMIFVAAGWVDVVYEAQGEPFRMYAGDCVLQPPEIRHRVLRSSPGLEVIEIGCPAHHETVAEHTITLPTSLDPDREFGGQRFVRHIASEAATGPSMIDGFTERDTGIEAATGGLAGARVLTAAAAGAGVGVGDEPQWLVHDGELAMAVVLAGRATLEIGDVADVSARTRREPLHGRDAVAIPPGTCWRWSGWSADFQLLDVTLPARAVSVSAG